MKRPRNVGEAMEVAKKLPTYARLVWGLARDERVPTQQKLVLGAIAAYLAFPIDIVPDFIPVLGQLDDVGVVLFGLDWFIRNAPPEVVDDHIARIARHEDTLSKDLASAGTLLQGRTAELRARLEEMRARRGGNGQE
jgi:uncharacterized membrane protein YkvA (DUF1232 family)